MSKSTIKSMTGFASLTRDRDDVVLTVTVKSVNHRYLDVQIRAPHALAELERDIRDLVQRQAARGRVELAITMQLKSAPEVEVELNASLMAALSRAATVAQDHDGVTGGLSAGDLFRFPHVVTVRERSTDEAVWSGVCDAVRAAVAESVTEWNEMRRREGEFLSRDLAERAEGLAALVEKIVDEAATGESAHRERLTARVAELTSHIDVDAVAIAQEVVRWAARSDIHEEVARLRGHLEHMAHLSAQPESCGRKLDFLVQEMNREVNTIGSKAEGRGIAKLVVGAKAEIEKLREQIQNVE